MPVFQLQDRHNEYLSPSAKSAISRAKTSWLKNTEVVDLLVHHEQYRLPVSSDPPNKPAGKLRCLRAKFALSTEVPECGLPSTRPTTWMTFLHLLALLSCRLKLHIGFLHPGKVFCQT